MIIETALLLGNLFLIIILLVLIIFASKRENDEAIKFHTKVSSDLMKIKRQVEKE